MEMSKGRDRTISRRDDGKWVNKRNDADKASSVHDTQKDAIDSAESMLTNQGGGEWEHPILERKLRVQVAH